MPYKKRKDNLWCVYKHTSPSGGVYIGITSDYPLARWRNGRGYDCCEVMNKAIKKYGWENFTHEILFDNLTKEEACQKEIELIAFYKNQGHCYNLAERGTNGLASEETKKKMSSNRQRKNAHGWRHIVSSETKQTVAKKIKGIKRNSKTKEKLSSTHSKKVYQYNLDGELIQEWDSVYQASNILGLARSPITRCRLYQQKTYQNCLWLLDYIDAVLIQKYLNNEIIIPPIKNKSLLQKKVSCFQEERRIKTFDSIKEASKWSKITEQQIRYACKNNKIAGEYYWKYEEDYFGDNYFLYWTNNQDKIKQE